MSSEETVTEATAPATTPATSPVTTPVTTPATTPATSPEKPTPIFFEVGDLVVVKGCRFKVTYVNIGKQRLTLEPLNGEPGEATVPNG